jgi:prepilin-type N-terminal cleavage/methylation domain-containing protein
MKNKRGFTILEVSMVTVILGVLAAFTIIKYQKTIAANNLEKAANSLYQELRGLRPLAFKYDAFAKARFNTTAMQCTVWVDTSDNAIPKKYRRVSIFRLPPQVKIGTPSTAPSSWKFYAPAALSNTWKDSLTVEPDSRGEYSHGAVYLYSEKIPQFVYCIGIATSMQSIELHKWNGTSWTSVSL